MDAPCKDCPRVGCGSYHDICEEYQAYKKAKEKEYVDKRNASQHEADLNSVENLRIWRNRKVKGKR